MKQPITNTSIGVGYGDYLDLMHPERHEFRIFDIANALSNLCRFTGHVRRFYSVAQHSVYVAALVRPELRRAALLHDAAEAYVGDVSSPLKRLLPDYRVIEQRVANAIANAFDVSGQIDHPDIKTADCRVLMTEKRDLTSHADSLWPGFSGRYSPLSETIRPLSPNNAETLFLHVYYEGF